MRAAMGRLQQFLSVVKGSRDYAALRARVMDGIPGVLPARAWGLYRLDEKLKPTDIAARNVSDAFLQRYEEVGRENDPIMSEILVSHVPCHNLQPLSSDEWHCHPLYTHITERLGGLDHILQAPLLGDGRIVGTLNFGRCAGDAPFGSEEIGVVSALAHHVSTVVATLPECDDVELTDRELEIARLVAAGLNNAEIAGYLAISRNTVKDSLKRIFRKAHVDSRAELTARLASANLLR
jgi:DNA-binding CsgD family transcriptional regulator